MVFFFLDDKLLLLDLGKELECYHDLPKCCQLIIKLLGNRRQLVLAMLGHYLEIIMVTCFHALEIDQLLLQDDLGDAVLAIHQHGQLLVLVGQMDEEQPG